STASRHARARVGAAPARHRRQAAARAQPDRPHPRGAPVTTLAPGAIGAALDRVEGPDKVAGEAKYAYEYLGSHEAAYASLVQATIGTWRIPSGVASGH